MLVKQPGLRAKKYRYVLFKQAGILASLFKASTREFFPQVAQYFSQVEL